MSAPEASDDVASLADRLYLAVIHLLRRVRREDERLALSASQLSAITRLVSRGPMSVGELAEAEGVKPPTMTRLVQRLEEGGYVIRRPAPHDGRVWRIAHTTRAVQTLEEGRAGRVAAFGTQLAALRKEDRECLLRALDVLEALSADPS